MYLAVTADAYELPVAFADSIAELADRMGVHRNAIDRILWKMRKGMKLNKYRVYEVKVTRED